MVLFAADVCHCCGVFCFCAADFGHFHGVFSSRTADFGHFGAKNDQFLQFYARPILALLSETANFCPDVCVEQ